MEDRNLLILIRSVSNLQDLLIRSLEERDRATEQDTSDIQNALQESIIELDSLYAEIEINPLMNREKF